jgi:hypothetical protein
MSSSTLRSFIRPALNSSLVETTFAVISSLRRCIPLLESFREFDDVAVGVIPAKAGIQESWMPDQVLSISHIFWLDTVTDR